MQIIVQKDQLLVEVHGPDGFIAGWDLRCLHEAIDTSAEQCIEIGVVNHMLQAAFEAGQQKKAEEIRELIGVQSNG